MGSGWKRLSCGGGERLLKLTICRATGGLAEGYLLFAGEVSPRICRRMHPERNAMQTYSGPNDALPRGDEKNCWRGAFG